MTRVIAARLLKPGHVIDRLPNAGDDALPVVVDRVLPAKQRGYVIVEGTDANGKRVTLPLGHVTNHVEIRDELVAAIGRTFTFNDEAWQFVAIRGTWAVFERARPVVGVVQKQIPVEDARRML